MKVTIDVPAPTYQMELISRLRRKIGNYKLTLKQLQRAHFITKRLYESVSYNTDQYRTKLEDTLQDNVQLRAVVDIQKSTIGQLRNRIDQLEARLFSGDKQWKNGKEDNLTVVGLEDADMESQYTNGHGPAEAYIGPI